MIHGKLSLLLYYLVESRPCDDGQYCTMLVVLLDLISIFIEVLDICRNMAIYNLLLCDIFYCFDVGVTNVIIKM